MMTIQDMALSQFLGILLLISPLYIHCQDGTTHASVGQTSPQAQSQTSMLQSTAAVVAENTTKSTSTNSSMSPTTLPNGSSNASSSTPGSNSSSSPATNSTTPAPDRGTDASTLSGESSDGFEFTLGTEEPTTDLSTDLLQTDNETLASPTPALPAYYELCPSGLPCESLAPDCLSCDMNASCVYGKEYNTTCYLKEGLDCIGSLPLQKTYQCRYCYQTEAYQQSCTPANNCHVYACPKEYVKVNCTVDEEVLCLGSRNFYRRKHCNWTSGYKWSTSLILSVTLGGFGADRFYLGYWQSGLGKLFSFGGAGVWTLIDVLLIGVGYITPSDGSLYIY